MPNIPTFAESGVPGYEANAWWGFAVPAGTPPAIAKKLEVTLNEIVRSDTMRKQFEPLGFNMLGTTQEEFARFVEADTEKWANIIRESKIATE